MLTTEASLLVAIDGLRRVIEHADGQFPTVVQCSVIAEDTLSAIDIIKSAEKLGEKKP